MSLHERLRPERPGRPAQQPADDEDAAVAAPAVAVLRDDTPEQCGATTSVGPLGLDGPFPWDTPHAAAPASRVVAAGIASAKGRSAFGKSLLPKPRQPKQKKKQGFVERLRQQMTGAAGPAEPPPQEAAEPAPAKKAGAGSIIRDCLSPSGLAQIKTMMYDPKLALTIPMREVMGKLGRYGEIGDKDGVRRTVGELAEKLNVGAPQHGTVLVEQGLTGPVPSSLVAAPVPETGGKRSLDLTQGGRTLMALAPILGENGTLNWKDGLGRGWQRLSERFGLQAQGVVDVLVAPRGGPSAPEAVVPVGVGGWAVPAQGAEAVGQWAQPAGDAAGPTPGGGPVGTWTKGASDQAAAVGGWTAPAGGANAGAPPVGGWSVPQPGDPAGAAGAAPPGQWQTPAPGASSGVGQWAAPDAAAGGGAQPAVGGWAVPSEPGKGAGPVGQWTASGAAPADAPGGVGQWSAGPPKQGAAAVAGVGQGGAPGAAASAPPPVAIDAIKITDRMSVGDLVQQNPNITGLRIIEFIPQGQGPAKLREVANVAASLLKGRFGG